MSRRRVLLLLLLPCLLLLAGFRDAPLVNPEPVPLPAGVTDSAVATRLRQTLNAQGWIVTEERPGEIVSLFRDRDRTARIDLKWSGGKVALTYLDSENLKYHLEDGAPYIHKNYLSWIEDLSAAIAAAFAAPKP